MNKNEYTLDCVIASIGTLLDSNYKVYDFETVIGKETLPQDICSNFIKYVKGSENAQYITKDNFNEYLNKNLSDERKANPNIEKFVDIIFQQISSNKERNNSGLKDPKTLYKDLSDIRIKTNLANSLHEVTETDDFNKNVLEWSNDYFNKLKGQVSELLDNNQNTDNEIYTADKIEAHYKEVLDEREKGNVYSFHNSVFDSLISEGPTPGHGGIIAGSTGMGKSTLCLNLVNDLINADIPNIYFPIEMGLDNTIDRLVSLRSEIPFKEIISYGKGENINKDLRQLIENEVHKLKAHTNFAIINDPRIDMLKLKNYIKGFQSRLPGSKYCIVIIDLLLMIREFYDDGNNMAQMIERAINKLDILAKELGVHWIGVVQLNRSVESDKVLSIQSIDKLKPTRSSVKNSSALLERARWAITIFRKKYFADLYLSEEEASSIPDIAEIQLMKANDEQIGRKYMNFEGDTFKMTESVGFNEFSE